MAAVTEKYFAYTNSVHLATREVGFMPLDWMIITGISSAFLAHRVSAAEFLELLGLTWRTQIKLYGRSVCYSIDIEALSFLDADWRAPLTDQQH